MVPPWLVVLGKPKETNTDKAHCYKSLRELELLLE